MRQGDGEGIFTTRSKYFGNAMLHLFVAFVVQMNDHLN